MHCPHGNSYKHYLIILSQVDMAALAINDFIQGIIMLAELQLSLLYSTAKADLCLPLDGLGHISDPAVSSTPGIF